MEGVSLWRTLSAFVWLPVCVRVWFAREFWAVGPVDCVTHKSCRCSAGMRLRVIFCLLILDIRFRWSKCKLDTGDF